MTTKGEPMKDTKETLPALTPAMMLEKAITTGANVDVLEKLLALQERWEATQARKAFEQALADLRADLPDIVKTKQANMGPGRPTYRYEDLSEMVDALSPVLSRHGLSFRWRTESARPDAVTVTCLLAHRDGHSEQTSLTATHDHSGAKNPVQALGSTVTYLQRYTLKASLGIAASADDDAQAVAPPPPAPRAAPVAPRAAKPAQHVPERDMTTVTTPVTSSTEGVIEGVLTRISRKDGTKKDGAAWTRYGLLVVQATGAEMWLNTFKDEHGTLAASLEGREVVARYKSSTDKTGRTVYDLLALDALPDSAEANLPPELEDDRLL